MLGNQYDNARNYSHVKTKLCSLSLVIGELQDELHRTNQYFVEMCLRESDKRVLKFRTEKLNILQSPN